MATTVCDILEAAGLTVLRPNTAAYTARNQSYWSVSARINPTCIVQPRSTEQVAQAITILKTQTTCKWAVRGGGHASYPGASNISDGVTLDLGLMNQTEYDADGQIAKIGAGGRWHEVYTALEPFGVTVPGGRASQVGVAGFLLGGGNSFFSSMVGLGCDSVINFEVVLASGQVVNANREVNADLHKALKGGSGNFGVVTRFDVQAFPIGDLWGGQVVYPLTTTEQHIAAYVDWVDNIRSYP
ncbi:hypothetical protein PFICI_10021 [Pestalotiopsis fici W106-1]|uniref:FAD-binding PCMH-type domain-containing protein n=1 Tax=Pestalotiopsis fici (strain W106-1 / CGMCC3.15140) TaxID=1229662 RepID=W3WVW1_PESFW|nr:uncharacterized protein PFICI_10021 [Pestalotiopsis fici W106-1]ETS77959.1 hypothetical protein PFICI_10021 [Pestalotiopsis fici W106-1]